jgi:tRNA A37 threonylcarbamoyladenosine synthetase subunit TsaC/SUA5/YrdC
MPNHPGINKLLEQLGEVYCSSANVHGHPPVLNDQEASKVFAKFNDQLVLIEGEQHDGASSTIIDFDLVKTLRTGSLDPSDIMKILRE